MKNYIINQTYKLYTMKRTSNFIQKCLYFSKICKFTVFYIVNATNFNISMKINRF